MPVQSAYRARSTQLVSILVLISLFFQTPADAQTPQRDGKLLRGEMWEKFSYPETADFYVSPQGNDLWSGTLPAPNADKSDGPFATLERAQKAVRELKNSVYFPKDPPVETRWIGSPHPLGRGKDILVYLRGGTYSLQQPLVFYPEDAGERVETNLPTGAFEYHKLRDHYVTYAGYPGETAVISGGQPVSGWKQVGKIWKAPYREAEANMLLVGGERQTLARTPNSGYFVPPAISGTTNSLYFNPGEIDAWDDMEENRIVMLLRWHRGINSITSVDKSAGKVTLANEQPGIVEVPPRYYIENVKALLDAPGEWYFDKKTAEISYMAPIGVNPHQVHVSVPKLSNLLTIAGNRERPVRNLRIYGITFEGAIDGSSMIDVRYAHAVELVGNRLRSGSGKGIAINEGAYQTRIEENHFQTIDGNAIHIKGPDNPMDGRDITRETLVSRNELYDCGSTNIYASHSLMTTISRNYITKTRGRYSIDVGGWANQEEAIDGGYLVEYNHLDDVQQDADDSGAIKTAGLSFNSFVRRNLIHDVRAGFFNDNVGFWFDNMSSGWTTEENIYYNLEQGEMKLCAAYLEDNRYENNFVIEAPLNAPEKIIEGEPRFEMHNLQIKGGGRTSSGAYEAGSSLLITAEVFNTGSSGIAPVIFYLNGKVWESKPFAVIRNNRRTIEFEIRIYDAGEHQVAIGTTPYQTFKVEGEKPDVVLEGLKLSASRKLAGEKSIVRAIARNLTAKTQTVPVAVYLNGEAVERKNLTLDPEGSLPVQFEVAAPAGQHIIRIGNSQSADLQVFASETVDISKAEIHEYCSAKAKPYEIEVDKTANRITIVAAGSDFFHAEDSYAAAYLKGIKGDFVATVTIQNFGERTHEWFRAGLFARNVMEESFDVQPGSKGSVLLFGTPGRAGIEYDEFGNGCMHKASSQNLPENAKTPVYLKLVRHGNSFSGFISLDGENWIIERYTPEIPGIAEAIDLGLAAGAPDRKPYRVEFSDLKVEVAIAGK